MPFYIAIYDWSQYTLPEAIPMANIVRDTHTNDPAHLDYSSSYSTWIGETFTYNGGSRTQLELSDDDGLFEDRYVETGGAQTLTQDVTINGTPFLAGSIVENEFSMVDTAGNEVYVVRIDGVNVGFGYPVGQEPTKGTKFTATQGRDGDPLDSGDGISSSSQPYSNIVCYAQGTLIDTPDGPRAVESLCPGDLIMTIDHGPQAIRWTHSGDQPLEEADDEAKPVQIKAGALGHNLPAHDLVVSPQHRILVGGAGQLQQVFTAEAFAPAKSLTRLPGIRHMKGKTQIKWIHFACNAHQVVIANGCLSESLLLGPMVINGLQAAERLDLCNLFGAAATPDAALNGPPARDCLNIGSARRQIAKHLEEKGKLLTNEIGKWDRDHAMEKDEAERMNNAQSLAVPRVKSSRVA